MIGTGHSSQGVDIEAQPEDLGGSVREMNERTSAQEGEASGNQGEGSTDSTENGRPRDPSTQQSTKMPRMVGDFDDNANPLWSLHAKEAKSHDEAQIQSLKNKLMHEMDSPRQGLQVDPAQQLVYYQQQNVALLAQISQQISSIAPHLSIPSTLPPPYPDFRPSSSDVRVNAYWFISLVCSLSAALLATLVQRWVRDYMHVFQRYSHPLKSARLRQYLYEGAEGWHMPVVAEFVPGLVHMSLFLFFLGLSDSLLTLNTTIGITTTILIAVCGSLYIFCMFAPVLYPQSPFRNSFSGLIWYLIQKVHPRKYLDRAFGSAHKPVSSNMFDGQMQLAMEENDERQFRDVRAVQWLIQTLTEDIEVEPFVLAIPGSFSTEWGIKVWRKASYVEQYGEADPSSTTPVVEFLTDADLSISTSSRHGSPHPHPRHLRNFFHCFVRSIGLRTLDNPSHDVIAMQSAPRQVASSQASDFPHTSADPVQELCKRVQHLFDTCKNRNLFATEDLWRRRARACTETAASFVCMADIKLESFGNIGRLLSNLGKVENIQELSAVGFDGSFVARWTCLSLVAIRGMVNDDLTREHAGAAIASLSRFQTEGDGDPTNNEDDNENENENALKNARKIDSHFETTTWFCVFGLDAALRLLKRDNTEEQVRKALARDHEADISRLEHFGSDAAHMMAIDSPISLVDRSIRDVTRDLIIYLPSISFDRFEGTEPIPPSQRFASTVTEGRSVAPQFMFLPQRLQHLCSYGPTLRNIIEGRSNTQTMFESLSTIQDDVQRRGLIVYGRRLMELQLWRLQDLRHGEGFGFSVELFFLALSRHFSMSSSQNSNSALYIGTFKVITSDWRQHKHSIGTQRVILNLVCDIASYGRGIFSDHDYPSYITEELLVLLQNMVEGQSGSHIDDALEELNDPSTWIDEDSGFARKAIKVISQLPTSS